MAEQKRGQAKRKGRTGGQGSTRVKRILPIALFAICCYTVSFCLCAFITLYCDADKSKDLSRLLAFVGTAAFLSGGFAGLREKKNGLLIGFLTTAPIHLCLFFLSLVMGGFHADFTVLFAFFILTILSMLGGVLAVNRRQRPQLPVGRQR